MRRVGRITVVAVALVAGAFAPMTVESAALPADPPIPIPKPGDAVSLPALPAPPAAPAPATVPPPASGDPIADLINHQAMPVVLSTRLGEGADKTRFVVEISDPVQVHVFTLTNPDRVVIDMPEVLWHMGDQSPPSGRGPVQSYRYGLFRKGNSRFVIDLAAPVRVDGPRIYPPEGQTAFRLVLDLTPTTDAQFAARAGWPIQDQGPTGASIANLAPPHPAPAPATPPTPSAPAGKRMIIVDAGHGGIDPGTHGETGLQEKDIVLAVARRLRDTLQATGHYKVTLTRETDVFVPLRDRVVIARAAHGDLFVSLHIDFNEHHEVRGASIYTLSEKGSDQAAQKLAERENMSDVIAGVDLSHQDSQVASILIDLAQRDTINRSARFSQTVLDALSAATLVRPISPHKSAAFAVLKGPDIPAVLIELGYLSNTQDEAMMATDQWRRRVARAIASAIDTHFARDGSPNRQAAMP